MNHADRKLVLGMLGVGMLAVFLFFYWTMPAIVHGDWRCLFTQCYLEPGR